MPYLSAHPPPPSQVNRGLSTSRNFHFLPLINPVCGGIKSVILSQVPSRPQRPPTPLITHTRTITIGLLTSTCPVDPSLKMNQVLVGVGAWDDQVCADSDNAAPDLDFPLPLGNPPQTIQGPPVHRPNGMTRHRPIHQRGTSQPGETSCPVGSSSAPATANAVDSSHTRPNDNREGDSGNCNANRLSGVESQQEDADIDETWSITATHGPEEVDKTKQEDSCCKHKLVETAES